MPDQVGHDGAADLVAAEGRWNNKKTVFLRRHFSDDLRKTVFFVEGIPVNPGKSTWRR
jgi:hypothetical protein